MPSDVYKITGNAEEKRKSSLITRGEWENVTEVRIEEQPRPLGRNGSFAASLCPVGSLA